MNSLDIVCRKKRGWRGTAAEVAVIDLQPEHVLGEDRSADVAHVVYNLNPDRLLEPASDWPCSCVKGKPCYIAQYMTGGGTAEYDEGLWVINPDAFARWLRDVVIDHPDWEDCFDVDDDPPVSDLQLFGKLSGTTRRGGDPWRV
tara:strand:+ start:826 stop:1257 length:432 start_codon:yes stop_codon:yes gene_type:complete